MRLKETEMVVRFFFPVFFFLMFHSFFGWEILEIGSCTNMGLYYHKYCVIGPYEILKKLVEVS